MSESNHIAEQLNYKFKNLAAPKYKFSRIVPLSGNQTVNVPIASTAETLMEIPTNVVNFHESYLYANINIPAQGATSYQWWHCDGMPLIQEIDLYTRSGIYLCQLPNFQYYMKIMRKLNTFKEEYCSSDPQSFLSQSKVNSNVPPAVTPNNGPASVPYEESAYVNSSAALGIAPGTTAASDVNLTLNFPLRAIKKTIFAMNKDLVFPDILVLRILWGPSNKFAYAGSSGVDPTAGVADISAQVVISNFTLYLATEKNEDLAQTVRALVNSPSGMNILIDYPYTYRNALNGASQSVSLRFNRGHGKNLLEVVSSPFNNTDKNNTAYDCFNIANASTASQTATGAKVQNYYSQLDNVRLQDIQVNCGNIQADDWRENRKFMDDTPYLNSAVYNNNWFHKDRFYEESPLEIESDENLDKGMSLIVERKYDLYATTTSTNYNWYTHAIMQKDLHIGSQMVQFQ